MALKCARSLQQPVSYLRSFDQCTRSISRVTGCNALIPLIVKNPAQHADTSNFTIQKRDFIPGLSNPFSTKQKGGKKLQYSECHLLGYSMVQMFDIVSQVDLYHEFVPWCKESSITSRQKDSLKCKLTVGFPPLLERYTSLVTLSKPHLVKSECSDGMLFNELLTIWRFAPGLDDRADTCTLKFYAKQKAKPEFNDCFLRQRDEIRAEYTVSFEFRSSLHTQLAQMFFDEVVRTMVDAFLKRALALHGPQSIKPRRMKITDTKPSTARST